MSWHFAYVAVIELDQSPGSPDDVKYLKEALTKGIQGLDLARLNDNLRDKKYKVVQVEVNFTHAKADERRS